MAGIEASVLATDSVNSAISAAEFIAAKLPSELSRTAQRLYTALVGAAVETGRGRGYSPHTTHVTMHLPLEVLASVCGIHRVTAWRHLPALRELGVLDYRPHKGTLRGETRNSGMLWQVRLNPSAGTRARLSYDDLKHRWRDLDRDVKRKRTAYRTLKDHAATVIQTSTNELDISRLLEWTLPPKSNQTPLNSDCCKPSLEAILDVRYAARDDRNQMVRLAAEALATALADQSGVNWYQKLLWQLLRRSDATGEDYSYQVYLAAQRAQVDRAEGFMRGAGLFVSRLKQADWYEWVMNAPPVRVGTRPN
jgi:DNA-binding IclR family transcriptional regulator